MAATGTVMKLLLWLGITVAIAWGALALWFDGPASRWLTAVLAALWVVGCLALLVLPRPFWVGVLAVSVVFLVLIGWWLSLSPSNDRDWLPDVARLPRATIDGDRVTVHNLRNFDYRTENDYTEHWETRTFDLKALRGVDLFLSFWGPTLIAHTIVSWQFSDGSHLAVSIETRKEKGESYSAIKGFFRQFELYYVVADERDMIRLRSNYRGEQVYLYRIEMAVAEARALLLDYLAAVNHLAEHPRWYNALTLNCTTAIRLHMKRVVPGTPWDWRILANGLLDELLYERGTVDTSLSLAELRERSDITAVARAADRDAAFSQRIRAGLPGRN
jgi:hypothetical protein